MATANEARGAALRAAREARPWTQAHLAAVANLHPRTVMRAEAGGHAGAETLMALCDALGIDAASLPRDEHGGPGEPGVPADGGRGKAAGADRVSLGIVLAVACVLSLCAGRAGVMAYGLSGETPLGEIAGRNVALELAVPFAEAGAAVAEGRPRDGRPWEALPASRVFDASDPGLSFCQKRDFAEIASGIDNSCPNVRRTLVVRASGPDLWEATIGPLRERTLRDVAALLPRDPRVRVTLALGREREPSRDGMLWTEPAVLAPGQEAAVPWGAAYAHVRMVPAGAGR